MLIELRVESLGVLADLSLVLGPGMTALTGETGAGKTLVVEAIELLVGGRADPVLVRPGDAQATVEARFAPGADNDDLTDHRVLSDHDDLILSRTVPATGRSRAYVDGRMAPLSALAAEGERLVDLHGQHAHQSLLLPAVQRQVLDRFAGIDHGAAMAARAAIRAADEAMAALGGDARARAREIDLLRFQVAELDDAGLDDPLEDRALASEEDRLADAAAHRESATAGCHALTGDGGVVDALGAAIAIVAGRPPLAAVHERLRASAAEVADAAADLRALAEGLEDDPERLAAVRGRRQLLRELRRKYGDDLEDVIAYRIEAVTRLRHLESHDDLVRRLEAERAAAQADLDRAELAIGAARRVAAPKLAEAVEQHLRRLAMPRARFEVAVGDDRAGDEVTWRLGANSGEGVLPLRKVASGGELARTMLAVRLAVGRSADRSAPRSAGGSGGRKGRAPAGRRPSLEGPDRSASVAAGDAAAIDRKTLVFDEVDAGIGGEAAVAVGRALADLAREQQVLVVTHLPQVAAFADRQIAVRKDEVAGRTVASASVLDREGRIVELSRMLSGRRDSATARRHAEELLSFAADCQPSSTLVAGTR
jgi:DNA repair protein RecN (Recombination protein N)